MGSSTDCSVIGLTTFNKIWRKCVPHIKVFAPGDGVCAVRCETTREDIMDAVIEEKLAITRMMQYHITSVQNDFTSL